MGRGRHQLAVGLGRGRVEVAPGGPRVDAGYAAPTRVRWSIAWSLAAALSVTACAGAGSPTPPLQVPSPAAQSEPDGADVVAAAAAISEEPVRLVTLGDGYTNGTGTSVPRSDSWPSQLASAMERGGVRVLWLNLAQQSHTSDLVIEEQLAQVAPLQPDVVTLQVGVNDIISRDTSFYRQNVEAIFDELLTILPPERIFAITTPDHTLTDYGLSFGPSEVGHLAVESLNTTLETIASIRGIGVIDISSVNELAARDPSLVIGDGPYGTPKQYAGWVEIIGPRIRAVLSDGEP
jgi:hypothetical protein